MESLRIGPLGVETEIAFADAHAAALRAEVERLWERVPSVGGEVRQRFVLGQVPVKNSDPAAPGKTTLSTRHIWLDDTETLLAYLTSMVTIDTIMVHPMPSLLLHASAVADDAGRVIGFVGPSGAGKTTLTRVLGRHFSYVTDETLVVSPEDLTVSPYPKPMSLVKDKKPKQQRSPSELELCPLPEAPLRLHRLVVIDRDPSLGDSPAVIEPMSVIDATLAICPQTSRLNSLDRPLQTLTNVFAETGGALRVRYGEAARLVELVPRLLTGADAALDPTTSTGHKLQSVTAPKQSSWQIRTGVEWYLDSTGRTLVYARGELHELQGVAPLLWRVLIESKGAASLSELVAKAVAAFGPPPEGETADHVNSAMAKLAQIRLVEIA